MIAHSTFNPIIYWREIILPFFVVNIDDSPGGEQHGIPSIPCRHDAIEHIYTKRNCLKDIPWSAHTHQISRLLFGKMLTAKCGHFIKLFIGLADA